MAMGKSADDSGDYAYVFVDKADVRDCGDGTFEIRVSGIVRPEEEAASQSNKTAAEGRGGRKREFDTFGFVCPKCRMVAAVATGLAVIMYRGSVEADTLIPPAAGPQ